MDPRRDGVGEVVRDTIAYLTFTGNRILQKAGFRDRVNMVSDRLFVSDMPQRGEEEAMRRFVMEKSGGGHLGLILSALLPREVNHNLLDMNPTRPAEWKKIKIGGPWGEKTIMQLFMPLIDFNDAEEVDDAHIKLIMVRLLQMYAYFSLGLCINAHCKMGSTRSAYMMALFISLFILANDKEFMSKKAAERLSEAIKIMAEKRPQINIKENMINVGVRAEIELMPILKKYSPEVLAVCCIAVFIFSDQPENKDATPEALFTMAIKELAIRQPKMNLNFDETAKQSAIIFIEELLQMYAMSYTLEKQILAKIDAREKKEVAAPTVFQKEEKLSQITIDDLNQLFRDPGFKKAIKSTTAHGKLCDYLRDLMKGVTILVRTPKRAKNLNKFLSSINDASDGSWYLSLKNRSGPSYLLRTADPFWTSSLPGDDLIQRETMLTQFEGVVDNLVCQKLRCTIKDIDRIAFPSRHLQIRVPPPELTYPVEHEVKEQSSPKP